MRERLLECAVTGEFIEIFMDCREFEEGHLMKEGGSCSLIASEKRGRRKFQQDFYQEKLKN